MKVLFVFGGLPHYYNKILNKLNKEKELEISVLIPSENNSIGLGKGVYQSTVGIEFEVFQLEEYKTFVGKSFFRGFADLVMLYNPQIIVMGWPYIVSFSYNVMLRRLLTKQNIKLICKDIPFEVPKYHEARSFFWDYNDLNENLIPSPQNKWIKRIKYFLATEARKSFYRVAHAHVNYIEEAVDILMSYGVKKDCIFITYNSPDTDELFETKSKIEKEIPMLSANNFRIIHVGRLVKWKRVDLLIEAVANLKNKYSDIELIVVGTGPEMYNLKAQSIQLKVSNHIQFVGGVYDNELLGKYLLESTIYILAGMGGLSINDAMCFGKPIICSVCDGTEKKLVRNNVNGFIFENGNLGDLIKKIDALFADQTLISQMGKMSISIIKNEINEGVVIEGYKKAFNYVNSLKQKNN